MLIQLKKSLEENAFSGRQNEKTRLKRFLDNKMGGTLLVAGERGAGKSSLIDNTIDYVESNIQPKYSPLRLTRSKFVRVELPFLPKHLQSNSSKEEYKAVLTSLILKALVQSLASENEKRIRHNVDIRTRWFRPIGYIRELDELDKLTRYTSITEKISKTIKLPDLPISRGSEIAFDHDLSDTIIEVRLRRLLHTYSRQLKFVFVFDELDKLQDAEVVDFIYYLKNLFTHSGAYFIFVTTDQVYLDINKLISEKPYDIEHTLFTEKMLLNNLPPAEFNDLISGYFEESSERESIEYFCMSYAIAWKTKQHPYDAINLLRRSQTEVKGNNYIDTNILNGLLDSLNWTYHSTMQAFIDYVYSNYSNKNDYYFNKILYKSLRVSAQNVFDNRLKIINRQSMLSALYVTEDFYSELDEYSSKRKTNIDGFPELSTTDIDDWRSSIKKLPSNQIQQIEKSLLNLIFLLNREGSLQLSLTKDSPDDNNLLEVVFVGDVFSLSNLRIPFHDSLHGFDEYYNPTHKMIKLREATYTKNKKFYNLFNENFWAYSRTVLFGDETTHRKDSKLEFSKNYRYLLSVDVHDYEAKLDAIDNTMKSRLISDLNSLLRDKKLGATQFELDSSGNIFAKSRSTYKTYKIVFNQHDLIKDNSSIVYFNLKKSSSTNRVIRSNNWKEYSTGKDWSRIKHSLKLIVGNIYEFETNSKSN